MVEDLLFSRLRDMAPANAREQEHLLAELLQQFILVSLSRSRFFEEACFHGGTSLRILHGLQRFSDDLDFLLDLKSTEFRWAPYLARIVHDCALQGIQFEVQDSSGGRTAVKKAILKTDLSRSTRSTAWPFPRQQGQKIRIKLEVDTNPPTGSASEIRYLSFPVTAALAVQTLSSGFSLKCHALLCRKYAKGRDWYDFIWYVSRRVRPDLGLLHNALDQQGPWAGSGPPVTVAWLLAALRKRIRTLDWRAARQDVSRFLPGSEQPGLELWGHDLFLQTTDRLGTLLATRG